MTKYSKFRDVFDDFAMPSQFGNFDNSVNTRRVIDKMLGPDGADLERNFGALMKLGGKNGDVVLNSIQNLRAAKNLSKTYSPSISGLGIIPKRVLLPELASPQTAAQFAAKQGGRIRANEKAPMLKMMAESNEFIKKLSKEQKLELFSNPALYRSVLRPWFEQDAEQQELTTGMP
jgi:hypothetical protein